mmetsp:Transcript_13619/g.29583  ORF Transcript_13619/g.29583 Transcript_13619/m.29583 type:complete len:213 (+) Transcript_13619:62-700(+)
MKSHLSNRMELVVLPAEEKQKQVDSPGLDDGVGSIFGGYYEGSKEDFKGTSADIMDYDAEPGNFHLGQYHFSQGGVRYLSSNCKQCQDSVALLHHGKSINSNNSKTDLSSLSRANSKNLAARHSALDVQNCSSTMCSLCCSCNSGFGGRGQCRVHSKGAVAFIKTGGATFLCQEIKESSSGEDSAEENTPVELHESKNNSPRRRKIAFWSKK